MNSINLGSSLVVKAQKNEIKKACCKLFDFLDFKSKSGKIDKFIIKPNLVSAQSYTCGSITDPLIVEELVRHIRDFSGKEILVIESESVWKTRKTIEHDEPDYD